MQSIRQTITLNEFSKSINKMVNSYSCPTQCTWVWANSGSWWWTGRPGVLQSMGLQRVGHDRVTELKQLFQRVDGICHDLCPEEILAECIQWSKLEKHTPADIHIRCGYSKTKTHSFLFPSLSLLSPSFLSLSLSSPATPRVATLSTDYQIWSSVKWPEW